MCVFNRHVFVDVYTWGLKCACVQIGVDIRYTLQLLSLFFLRQSYWSRGSSIQLKGLASELQEFNLPQDSAPSPLCWGCRCTLLHQHFLWLFKLVQQATYQLSHLPSLLNLLMDQLALHNFLFSLLFIFIFIPLSCILGKNLCVFLMENSVVKYVKYDNRILGM